MTDALAGPLIERCLKSYPRIKVRIVTGYSGYVLDWLQRGTVDIGILYEAHRPPTKTSRRTLPCPTMATAGFRPSLDSLGLEGVSQVVSTGRHWFPLTL